MWWRHPPEKVCHRSDLAANISALPPLQSPNTGSPKSPLFVTEVNTQINRVNCMEEMTIITM